ncbi:hypothetical protein P43SY_004821 [Pythium insidiosum]|uniref:Uncharacterized protein n=1 Tax=Pythium insidiosum TaxID=114742 RepID=A0AAD5Q1L7_PYTIN|nr:hypothetical protein P43SY_004821 [Pythium insidiosum]
MQQRQDQSLRREFYTLCKEHLASRDGGGYITTQASRLLLKHVKAYMLKLPLLQRNLEAVTRKVLDKFPEQRIDLDVLEKYELVPRDRYAVCATGDEFKYTELLGQRVINGEPKMLVKWEPTWEPLANIRKRDLKDYHDKEREERKKRRLARSNAD